MPSASRTTKTTRASTSKDTSHGGAPSKKQRTTNTEDSNSTLGVVTIEGSENMVSPNEDVNAQLHELKQIVLGLQGQFDGMQGQFDGMQGQIDKLKDLNPGDVTKVKTSAAKSDLTAGTEIAFAEHLNTVLRTLIRERFFKLEKFVSDEEAEMIVKQAMFEKRIHPMDGQTEDGLREQCTQIVKTTFNCLRGHMQSQARKNFLSKICCFRQVAVVLRMSNAFLTSQRRSLYVR